MKLENKKYNTKTTLLFFHIIYYDHIFGRVLKEFLKI